MSRPAGRDDGGRGDLHGVAAAILAYAEEYDRRIIIGHHGHGGRALLLAGGKGRARAPCPVLTVRHPEREFIQPGPRGPLHA